MAVEFTERGFAQWPTVESTYGAELAVYESSRAGSPHLWLSIDQPKPEHGGQLDEAHAVAHLTLDQAERLRATLDQAIQYMRDHG